MRSSLTKADRQKAFQEKAYSGFLVGYATQNTGYLVIVPLLNKIVSMHVVNEIIIADQREIRVSRPGGL